MDEHNMSIQDFNTDCAELCKNANLEHFATFTDLTLETSEKYFEIFKTLVEKYQNTNPEIERRLDGYFYKVMYIINRKIQRRTK